MKLKDRSPASTAFLGRLFALERLAALAVAAAGLGATLALGVILGQRLEESGQSAALRPVFQSDFAVNVVDPAIMALKSLAVDRENVPANFARGVLGGTPKYRLSIDIKQEDYQKLSRKRDEALALGVLLSGPDDWRPAKVTWNGNRARVKLRLKGDWPDHYRTDKWSLRVRVRGDNTLDGMKSFSIQHPATRNYLTEWVAMEALRREGVLTPRYDFVDVTINGNHKGIYALEQHFDKQLIEHNRAREGPIVKFNEDLLWQEYLSLGTWYQDYGAEESSAIDGWAADTAHGSAFERAVGLLEGFRRGAYATSKVFDVDRLAMFFAMRDLTGSPAVPWENLRFYYNPVTSRLEPIAYDNGVEVDYVLDRLFCYDGGISDKETGEGDPLTRRFFSDPAFLASYVKALEHLSEPAWLERLLTDLEPSLRQHLAVLERDYPYVSWSSSFLRRNQAFLRAALAPEKALHAYHEATSGEDLVLDVANIQSLPLEVLGVSVDRGATLPPLAPLVLGPKRVGQTPLHSQLRVRCGAGGPPPIAELQVRYRILGSSSPPLQTAVFPWSPWSEGLRSGDWLLSPSPLREFPFLVVDEGQSTIRLKPGRHTLGRALVIPAGRRVLAGPGVTLDLRHGAKIVSYSPLDWHGDEEAPVVIESTDGTGQGLVVLRAGADSRLARVRFVNLDAPAEHGYQLTGSVTFYESPVEMQNVVFQHSRSEDALNVIRSRLHLARVAFVDTDRDAFDGDFVEGRIEDSSFTRCGNDAVDISGSVLRLDSVRMSEIGDKGLSVGEDSHAVARRLHVSGAEIAVAAKDLSTVELEDSELVDGGVGFTVFRKKPEFGEATIRARRVVTRNLVDLYLVEKGSRLTLDGKEVPAVLEKVESMLYGARFGRASRR